MRHGYLRPVIIEGEGGKSYLDIRAALKDIKKGTSYNSAAQSLNTTRQTLSTIDEKHERRAWYLDAETSSDARVKEVLQDVQH